MKLDLDLIDTEMALEESIRELEARMKREKSIARRERKLESIRESGWEPGDPNQPRLVGHKTPTPDQVYERSQGRAIRVVITKSSPTTVKAPQSVINERSRAILDRTFNSIKRK